MGISRSKRRARRLPVPAIGRRRKRPPLQIARRSKRLPVKLGPRAKRLPVPAIGRPSWKLVGLAGLAGVAATGAAVARNRRAHRDLPPEELRDRLRDRLAAVDAQVEPATPDGGAPAGAQPPRPAA
jgi:hypothetical protein